MKKYLFLIVAMMLIGSTVVIECSAANRSKFSLKLSHQLSKTHSLNDVAEKFASIVKQKTNGNVEIRVYPSASLGSERENAEALKTGTLDLAIIAVEFYPAYVAESATLVLPFMYKDYEHANKVLNGEPGAIVAKKVLDKTDIKIISYLLQPFRQIFTVEKPLNTVNDIKGLKIRVPESPIYVETFKQLGAVPTPIPFGECYTSLQTGIVKGVENAPETIYSSSLQEVTKYMNITNHIEGPTTISMSNAIFKKLPKNYQKILIQAAAEVSTYNYKNIVSRDEEYRHKLSQDLEVIKTDISSFKNKIDYSKFELLKSREAQTLVKKIEKIH